MGLIRKERSFGSRSYNLDRVCDMKAILYVKSFTYGPVVSDVSPPGYHGLMFLIERVSRLSVCRL